MGDTVRRRDGWLRDVVVAEFRGVGNHRGLGEFEGDELAPIVLEGGTNAPSVLAPEVPCFSPSWFGVNDDVDAERAKRSGAVIKFLAPEEVPSRDGRVGGRLAEEIECHLSLWE